MVDYIQSSITGALREALWADYERDGDYPEKRPLLAHYTSIEVLERIVRNNELWMSNPLYMNDWEELQFGINAGANLFRSHASLIRGLRLERRTRGTRTTVRRNLYRIRELPCY